MLLCVRAQEKVPRNKIELGTGEWQFDFSLSSTFLRSVASPSCIKMKGEGDAEDSKGICCIQWNLQIGNVYEEVKAAQKIREPKLTFEMVQQTRKAHSIRCLNIWSKQ